MMLGRLSIVLFAVSIWTASVFAQLPQICELSNSAKTAKEQLLDKAKSTITLRIDDFANISPAVLAGARKVTTEIFAEAGVQTGLARLSRLPYRLRHGSGKTSIHTQDPCALNG